MLGLTAVSATTPATRVLVVEDEAAFAELLSAVFTGAGFSPTTAHDGRQAIEMIESQRPDLVVLDIGLPFISGVEVLRRHRLRSPIPVIMLSANHDVAVKIKCLDMGAHDYVTKPFASEELLARVRAVLRRSAPVGPGPGSGAGFDNGRLSIDFQARRVTAAGVEVHLTPIEFAILAILARQPGQVHSKEELVKGVWGRAFGSEIDYLDTHISRLQSKLTYGPAAVKQVIAMSGAGYCLVNPAAN